MIADDRTYCTDCAELTPNRRCRAAITRRRKDVSSDYVPSELDLPRRCEFFVPLPGAKDQRTGRERHPDLFAEYETKMGEINRERREAAQRGIARAKAALNTS